MLRLKIDDLTCDEMQYAQAGGRMLPGESVSLISSVRNTQLMFGCF